MTLRKITENDLAGKGVVGMADVPGLSARELQQKVEEIVRQVVIPVYNENLENTVSREELGRAVLNAGAGDMSSAAYDKNHDFRVDEAENGFSTYTHKMTGRGHLLEGVGENIKFVATRDWNINPYLEVNGVRAYPVNSRNEDISLENIFTTGAMVTCFLHYDTDSDKLKCFFNTGGTDFNFTVTAGTQQPVSPEENTVWVETELTATDWIMSADEPEKKEGRLWLVLSSQGRIALNTVKKNGIVVHISAAKQYDGTQWSDKTVKAFINGQWYESDWCVFDSVLGINRGRWTGENSSITVTDSAIRVAANPGCEGTAVCSEGVDLTDFSRVVINVAEFSKDDTASNLNFIGLATSPDPAARVFRVTDQITSTGVAEANISSLYGVYYPKIQVQSVADNGSPTYVAINSIRFMA